MKKRLRFIKKKTHSPSQTQSQQGQPDTILSEWYRDLNDIPLHNFEDCLLNGNLNALTITGFPAKEQLSDAWDVIMMQYADAAGDDEYKVYIHLFKTVEIINIDIESIRFLVSTLRDIKRHQYFCDELNRLVGTDFAFPEDDLETYYKQLRRCELRAKSIKIRYDLKMMEYENLKKKIEARKGDKIDKAYFTGMLIMLSRHYQYRIVKDITMGEYCEMIRQYRMYCDKVKL